MRTKLFYILVLLGILTIGCSRKVAPTISLPTEQNPCDKAIKAVLDSVQSVDPVFIYDVITEAGVTDTVVRIDSTSCQQIKLMALDIVAKYNTAIKERDFYKALAQSQAKKITNNTYINSNNKKSQIGDGNVQQDSKSGTNQSGTGNVNQEVKKGPAQNGNDNVAAVKPKGSATGAGNKLDNSKKGSIWPWILLGAASWFIIQNVLWPIIKTKLFPWIGSFSIIKKLLT